MPHRQTEHDFNFPAIVASVALAVLLFYLGKHVPAMQRSLQAAGYAGTFVLGALFAFSFTSLPATALLAIAGRSQNLWIAGAVATLGAVTAELVVFGLFRSMTRPAHESRPRHQRYSGRWKAIEGAIPERWRPFAIAVVVVACLMFPVLPNEFAAFVLARTRRVKACVVPIIFLVCNAIGICTILWLARFG
jgi:uncharacterized membrane protein YdjX (TVP38/TMEM64 family)